MLTFDEAKALKRGDILLDEQNKRWKVSGEVKLWKKPENAHRIRVPLKHGLYDYAALTENDFPDGNCPYATKED